MAFLPLSLVSPSSLLKVPNCLSITRPWRFLYISAAQEPLYYSPLSLMQVKLARKLLYERDGDATLHPWARRQASYGSSRQGETLCELSSRDRVDWYNSTTSCLPTSMCATVANWIALVKDIERDSRKSERKRHKNDTLSKIARLYRLFTKIASHFAQPLW